MRQTALLLSAIVTLASLVFWYSERTRSRTRERPATPSLPLMAATPATQEAPGIAQTEEPTPKSAPHAKPFQRLDGCRLIPNRWNDGDSFHVMTADVPDSIRQIQAADGYCELGMWQEALDELESLPPDDRGTLPVAITRVEILKFMKRWQPPAVLAEKARNSVGSTSPGPTRFVGLVRFLKPRPFSSRGRSFTCLTLLGFDDPRRSRRAFSD